MTGTDERMEKSAPQSSQPAHRRARYIYLFFFAWGVLVLGEFLRHFWPFMIRKLAEFGIL